MIARCPRSRAWLSVLIVAGARVAPAQSIRVADSLLARGALEQAESMYYAAVRARPHDPVARWALGRYLAERGAPRVAATLMEEALQFGGEPHIIVPDLAVVYERLDEYRELLALAGAPLADGERSRASWLLDHPTRIIAPDTLLLAVYRGLPASSGYLGELPIRVNGRTMDAAIAPRGSGLVIADSNAIVARLHRFPTPEGSAARGRPSLAAAADSVGIGRVSLTNVPVTAAAIADGHQATIGLELLARFAPTFDAGARRVVLRPAGTIAPGSMPAGTTSLPTLLTRDELRVRQAGGWVPASSPAIASLLAGHRWTFDARRGALLIEP
ncbi:MAG: tetratricopeptide repeat protein [Gemmatimonadales bacterium]